MIALVGLFIVFLAVGFIVMRRLQMHRREVWAFAVISCMGFVLWASIVIDHPLDLNTAISWMIDSLF
ncbi:hypothetical protein M3194_13105 [Paenibacillus glycanilyticus]|uniref:hypothetical protein n=1 Tax=Paenibacillus glycanilyticus TaxID=126569 RepID=UPI00203FA958|nr:hypothetical protein [Paenibacillus glycanilyticus]MCM3628304.1 hypothetical protein [Paenibacillus glycanilyticus]